VYVRRNKTIPILPCIATHIHLPPFMSHSLAFPRDNERKARLENLLRKLHFALSVDRERNRLQHSYTRVLEYGNSCGPPDSGFSSINSNRARAPFPPSHPDILAATTPMNERTVCRQKAVLDVWCSNPFRDMFFSPFSQLSPPGSGEGGQNAGFN